MKEKFGKKISFFVKLLESDALEYTNWSNFFFRPCQKVGRKRTRDLKKRNAIDLFTDTAAILN